MRSLLCSCLLLLSVPLLSPTAFADEYDDLDNPETSQRETKQRKGVDFDEMEVREITRGFYTKTNIGGWIYLIDFRSPYIKPGTSMALAIGQDFLDRERSSMAWEVAFFQGIHNGMHYEYQSEDPAAPLVQGDLRTYSGIATLEYSGYPVRRVGIGARVGGGILFSPLLIDEDAWNSEVLGVLGVDKGYHSSPHPLVLVGPTFEYYTKMSHFSVGLDVDAIYAIAFDLGVSITGTLKYTF